MPAVAMVSDVLSSSNNKSSNRYFFGFAERLSQQRIGFGGLLGGHQIVWFVKILRLNVGGRDEVVDINRFGYFWRNAL